MSRSVPVFILAVLLGFISCNSDPGIRGDAFIPRDTFVVVLVDIHLTDGITNDRKFYRRFENVDSVDVLSPILEKHGVTHQQFDTTMYAYTRHPELFDQVYNEVIMELNMLLDDLGENKDEE